MAAPTPVASAEALVTVIQKSGLISAETLARVRQAAAKSPEPKALARELVKDGTLTRWQAEQLLYGFHRLIIGKYKLLDQLGTAPTGRLYLAEHVQMGRRHTIKVLAKRLAANPQAVKQFLTAAQNACGLDHRNISHVYDVNQDYERNNHYVVMEYVEGEDLDSLVQRLGRLPPLDAIDLLIQAAEGLSHAHQNGVVHGDLKPSNLLLDHSDTIKILEIGQAGTGATPQTDPVDESIEMAALGAVIFQPPELRGDGQVADVSTDMYSLGSILAFMLTGQASPDAATAMERMQELSEVPPELIELCGRMMADKPSDRPSSMGRVLEQLTPIVRQLVAAVKKAKVESSSPKPVNALVEQPVAIDPSKARKPPVAKPLDAAAMTAPAVAEPEVATDPPVVPLSVSTPTAEPPPASPPAEVVVPEASLEVADVPPAGIPAIQTRGRVGKKPSTPAGAKDSTEAAKVVVASPGMSPLVLWSAIGGGVVLLAVVAVVSMLLLRPKKEPSSSAPPAASKALPPVNIDSEEANPQPVGESNPEMNPAAAGDQISAIPESNPVPAMPPETAVAQASALLAKSEEAKTDLTPTSDAAATPVDQAASDPGKNEQAASEMKSSEAPKSENVTAAKAAEEENAEPKSEKKVAKAATKPASKPAAKPPAKVEPFKGLATAVTLPTLAESNGQAVKEKPAPAVLGPCKPAQGVFVTAELMGGDAAVRATKHRFELQPQANQARSWNVVLSGVGEPATIATLAAAAGNLLFEWTDEAVKQAAVAKQLCNCTLVLTAGEARHQVGLRTPALGSPLTVDLDKPGALKWQIGDLPPAKQLFVEVTGVEGVKDTLIEPKQAALGEETTVWLGDAPKSLPLAFRLQTSSNVRDIEVKPLAYLKLEEQEPRLYRRKEALTQQTLMMQQLGYLEAELKKTKDSRPKQDVEKMLREQVLESMGKQQFLLMKRQDQLAFATSFGDKYPGTALIHFRVYYQSGDVQLDLLRTKEPAKSKK